MSQKVEQLVVFIVKVKRLLKRFENLNEVIVKAKLACSVLEHLNGWKQLGLAGPVANRCPR